MKVPKTSVQQPSTGVEDKFHSSQISTGTLEPPNQYASRYRTATTAKLEEDDRRDESPQLSRQLRRDPNINSFFSRSMSPET